MYIDDESSPEGRLEILQLLQLTNLSDVKSLTCRKRRLLESLLLVLLFALGSPLWTWGSPEEAGVYRVEKDRHLIVRGTDRHGLSILDTKTGHVRNLAPEESGRFSHGPTRSRKTPATGTVSFEEDRVIWESELLGRLAASALPGERRNVTVQNLEEAKLTGSLFLPDGPAPHPVTVIVPLGDRSSLWEPAMWLFASGTGVFVYDQRGTGSSSGSLYGTERNSHTLETLQLADDAVAVVRHVRDLPGVDPDRVGILGWSQGGWIGAMAASRLPELAFYVNIAANANPWPEQAQHRFLARLQREGFSGESLEEAERYFQALRAVSDFRIGWQEYELVRDRYREDEWYREIIEIYPFFTYQQYGQALAGWSVETSPETHFRRLSSVPSVGIYFEFDHSNPPDSPRRFRRSLESAGNAQVTVKVFRDTNHGAWVVDGYAFTSSEIVRRDPEVFEFIIAWITAQTGE